MVFGRVAERIPRSLKRFLVAGGLTVALDATAYSFLLALGAPVTLAKIIGLICATLFAYVVNQSWTFGAQSAGLGQFGRFIAIYLAAIGLNVGVNALAVHLLGTAPSMLTVAWFLATASSSTWNYLMMRFAVFRAPPVVAAVGAEQGGP